MHVIIGLVVLVLGIFLAARASAKTKQDGVEAMLPEKKLGWFTVFELPGAYFFNTMEDLMGKKKATFFFPLIKKLAAGKIIISYHASSKSAPRHVIF